MIEKRGLQLICKAIKELDTASYLTDTHDFFLARDLLVGIINKNGYEISYQRYSLRKLKEGK
jgi:hypothetical protein